MKKLYIVLILLVAVIASEAQAPKKVLVEHFTNTRCSICASRNPDIFTNLKNHPGVLHISVHPSRPYASCILNQHNVVENDDRTKFYGVYGATPRMIVQGGVVPASTNHSTASLLSSKQGQMSPIEIKLKQNKKGQDSLQVDLVVKAVSSHSLTDVQIFLAVLEDTIFYNSPNGEREHFHVFRKALMGATGLKVPAPAMGDSLVYSFCVKYQADWNKSRMYPLALVQETSNKVLVQTERLDPLSLNVGIAKAANFDFKVLSFSSSKFVAIDFVSNQIESFEIIDLQGRKIWEGFSRTSFELNLSAEKSGVFLFRHQNSNSTKKFLLE